jgi:hypothetical protein
MPDLLLQVENRTKYDRISKFYYKLNAIQLPYKRCTVKLGYNEHSVMTKNYFGTKYPFTTQIHSIITKGFGRSELFVITEFH